MNPIVVAPVYRIYWVDEPQTTICLEVRSRWTWDDAAEALYRLNEALGKVSREIDTFSIIHFRQGVATIPEGIGVGRMRELLLTDPQYEKLVIYVGSQGLLVDTLKIASRVYGLQRMFERYRFVGTFEDALAHIHHYYHAHTPLKKDA